ncbi:hypothetical protein DM02DRAFT_156470 [Periconia macrospinosa]|uniref:Uncharacterized protein n=1 Tax=Periconia macrospinosa TaxID=97972 RepID=A0A2V1EDP3_9PLEO|nr:hypothetical protein DM02DRAFT_156470 [Periconia macrospinosa]
MDFMCPCYYGVTQVRCSGVERMRLWKMDGFAIGWTAVLFYMYYAGRNMSLDERRAFAAPFALGGENNKGNNTHETRIEKNKGRNENRSHKKERLTRAIPPEGLVRIKIENIWFLGPLTRLCVTISWVGTVHHPPHSEQRG